MPARTPFIFVHAGAGIFSTKDIPAHLDAVRRACIAGLEAISDPVDALVAAISIFEADPVTNAGRGSCLNIQGHVEVDASAMDGMGRFGAVGAAPGLGNPIAVATRVLRCDDDGTMPDGLRAAPMLVTGKGAWELARNSGLAAHSRKRKRGTSDGETETDSEEPDDGPLRTEDSVNAWGRALKRYMKELDDDTNGIGPEQNGEDSRPSDTVGAVVCNEESLLCAGASSGGPILKPSGRVGHAAIFGAGTWARNPEDGCPGVAVSTSGRGEQIIRTLLARELGEVALSASEEGVWETVPSAFEAKFLSSPYIARSVAKQDRESGAIISLVPLDGPAEICCIHSTPSMIVGYLARGMKAPVVRHLTKQQDKDWSFSAWSIG